MPPSTASGSTAPGAPGIAPHWTSSDKSGVGTALSALSRVWFTTSHGILNEIYYPRVDQACVRDFGLIVTDGTPGGFFAEEKRDTDTEITNIEDGVPAYEIVNRCRAGHYTIRKRIVTDPFHDVVLQEIRFETDDAKLRLFGLLAPHLVNGGADNSAWLGDYKGTTMLFAEGHETFLALGCSRPFLARSVGYVGATDGWQELTRHGALPNQWEQAPHGNVALCAEIDSERARPRRCWRWGSGAAGRRRRSGCGRRWTGGSTRWPRSMRPPGAPGSARCWRCAGHSTERDTYRISTAVLRAHDSPNFPGGIIASLSIPWGASKGDDDLGGYHLVWPRDLVETAGGLLACGAFADARRVAQYLRAVQEADGHWPQNCWLDGSPYWQGVQMDECAFPILLIDMMRRAGALEAGALAAYWPMVERACGFVLKNGPATGQDRWEEDGGYSTVHAGRRDRRPARRGADLADIAGQAGARRSCCGTPRTPGTRPSRNGPTSAAPAHRQGGRGGGLLRPHHAAGGGHGGRRLRGGLGSRSRTARSDQTTMKAADGIVSPDALALVRFGLRAADDPRDPGHRPRDRPRLLRVELPAGPCWYRYNHDGYGEHADGSGFDGTGIGRLWPLMTGERAHYELAAGRRGGGAAAAGDPGGLLTSRRRPDPRAGVGQRRHSRARAGARTPKRLGDAAGVGACRACQTLPLAGGRVGCSTMPPQTRERDTPATGRTCPGCSPGAANWRALRVVAGTDVLRLDLEASGDGRMVR